MSTIRCLIALGLLGCGGPLEEEEVGFDEDSASCYECDGIDDLPDSFPQSPTWGLGSSVSDEINFAGDADHLKFYQQAGVLTRIQVNGADCWLHYKSGAGTYPLSSYSDTNVDPGICYIQFSSTVSRWWYLRVARSDKAFGMLATTGLSQPGPSD